MGNVHPAIGGWCNSDSVPRMFDVEGCAESTVRPLEEVIKVDGSGRKRTVAAMESNEIWAMYCGCAWVFPNPTYWVWPIFRTICRFPS